MGRGNGAQGRLKITVLKQDVTKTWDNIACNAIAELSGAPVPPANLKLISGERAGAQFDSRNGQRTTAAKENAARLGSKGGVGVQMHGEAFASANYQDRTDSAIPGIQSFAGYDHEFLAMLAPPSLRAARAEMLSLASEAEALEAVSDYLRSHEIDTDELPAHLGAVSILPIVEVAPGRFVFDDIPEAFPAFVAEAFDKDGETVADLVAWPIMWPERTLTAFGVLPMLGMWNALNPASYFNGRPCLVHRSGLDWMRAGFKGVVIAIPSLARPILAAMTHMGDVAGADLNHAQWIKRLAGRHAAPNKILVPLDANGRAA